MIAVIIPTYNRRSTLERCLGSIEQQSYSAIEVIVVDDGSTDDTAEFIATLAKTSRMEFHYFHQPNSGCAAARNMGLRESRSDRFLFLDSDDALEPEAVESLAREMDRSGADFVYSPAIEVYPNGETRFNYPVAAGRPASFSTEHFLDPNVRNGAVMFHRRLLGKVGLVNDTMRYNEDSDFVQRYSLHGVAAYSDVPTVRHYHHAGNKSGNRVRIYEALLQSCEGILAANPEFRVRLGSQAAARLDEIRRLLLESLILTGDFSGAALVASNLQKLSLAHRLALAWHLKKLIVADRALRYGIGSLLKRMS